MAAYQFGMQPECASRVSCCCCRSSGFMLGLESEQAKGKAAHTRSKFAHPPAARESFAKVSQNFLAKIARDSLDTNRRTDV
jgi:hypothetical protein